MLEQIFRPAIVIGHSEFDKWCLKHYPAESGEFADKGSDTDNCRHRAEFVLRTDKVGISHANPCIATSPVSQCIMT